MANLNPSKWHEQTWERPVVIISGDSFNENWSMFIICPLTSKIKEFYGDVILNPDKQNWLTSKSEILVHHIRGLSIQRFTKKIWSINPNKISSLIKWLNQLLMC